MPPWVRFRVFKQSRWRVFVSQRYKLTITRLIESELAKDIACKRAAHTVPSIRWENYNLYGNVLVVLKIYRLKENAHSNIPNGIHYVAWTQLILNYKSGR